MIDILRVEFFPFGESLAMQCLSVTYIILQILYTLLSENSMQSIFFNYSHLLSRYFYLLHNLTDSTTYIVGSANDGSLSAIFIADAKCCKNLKARIAALKLKLIEILEMREQIHLIIQNLQCLRCISPTVITTKCVN